MAEYMHLIGAEDVRQAARNMQGAAADISSAVANFEDSLQRNRMFMDDWLERLRQVLTENQKTD